MAGNDRTSARPHLTHDARAKAPSNLVTCENTAATAAAPTIDTSVPGARFTLIGGPTTPISVGGLNLLTDPTFDPPGAHQVGGRTLTKLTGPAVAPDDLPRIDAVLLSHEQHPDNLDDLGRAVAQKAPAVYTNEQSAAKLGDNAVGLDTRGAARKSPTRPGTP